MPNTRSPRRGSLQFWPRKRARKVLPRRRSYPAVKETKLLSFPGYKVQMCHALFNDTRKNSMTKGMDVAIPATIIECPPIKILSVRFYKKNPDTGSLMVSKEILVSNEKKLARKIKLPKTLGDIKKEIESINPEEYDDIRVVCYTQPWLTSRGNKKAELFETAIGGSNTEKMNFIKENIGKDIRISDVFSEGEQVDITAVTKGKGFQGTVKRYGVAIRSHKSEKTKRGIANLGAWTPAHVDYTVPQPGKMGYHTRTEYNKWLLKISNEDINPKGGFEHYGLIKNDYILLKGSVAGPAKRVIRMTKAIRPNKAIPKESIEIEKIVIR